jgi:hypothetical protein
MKQGIPDFVHRVADFRHKADAIFKASSRNREKILSILLILSDKIYLNRIHS